MRHTKDSHNSTLYCTLLHTSQCHTLHSGAYTHDDPHSPISKSHFSAHTDHSMIHYNSFKFSRAAAGSLTPATLHLLVHTRIHHSHARYPAAGPLPILQYTVKYSMNTQLQALIASIILMVIWYVIYIWLLTGTIGPSSRLCVGTLPHSPHHTHHVRRFGRSLYHADRLWFKNSHTIKSILMQYTDAIQEPDMFCYQLPYFIDYDVESVWEMVQRHSGSVSYLNGGQYDFYIPREYASILILAFPQLRRQYQKDLYT